MAFEVRQEDKRSREQAIKDQSSKQTKVLPYANLEERKRMALVNPIANKHLSQFLDELTNFDPVNVLEVAMGEAQVSREVFLPRFSEIDMFDHDTHAVNMAKALQQKHPKIKRVEQSSMETYEFKTEYNLIFMRYASGYLNDFDFK